jgi:hypothetical protein
MRSSQARAATATSVAILTSRDRAVSGRATSVALIQIQAGEHTITAADPVPDDLQTALDTIHGTH